jgi:hypothetical protein
MTRQSVLERFMEKVEQSDGCWLWTGGVDRNGYGKFYLKYKTLIAHRVGYELLVGPIAPGCELDHTCHSRDSGCTPDTCLHRRCVNPEHLNPLTRAAHALRNGGGSRCRHGHPFTEDNVYRRADGRRECRACRQLRRTT